ncbi:SDR family NAD(P)-dependent oxidoreductase [Actinophytocola oryzae]|uniref:Short-subunit dehydrogenase n=1 Tax=Actinophytocola oryzae TaxID=502181 RepID=A0A4R7URU2_9PSEU|nr:SDR family oxidoreductase [Actinophytocola oryzae]TDV37768.1 short-subunit dehydrogenase [Actinophytocola oryzae]
MRTRTALVTGASRGIGRQIARRLAQEGYALTVSARREPGLLDAADELRAFGAEIHIVVTNLADEHDARRLAAAHATRFDHLDLLVLAAGVGTRGSVAEMPMKLYDLTLTVNLRSQFLLIQQTLPLLREAAATAPLRGARIVALASITGVAGEPGLAAYAAGKAALISLCETVTLEESSHHVTATAISPGFVDTDMTQWTHEALAREPMLTTDDVAELVLALTRLSTHAVVPNIVLTRAGERIWRP